jgi:DNA-directed RNA polymerase subunit M/transcription elongation factor TFIIS
MTRTNSVEDTAMSEPRLKCPKCDCDSVEAQVVVWWSYKDGKPQTQGDSYLELDDDGLATCEECGHQWRTFS